MEFTIRTEIELDFKRLYIDPWLHKDLPKSGTKSQNKILHLSCRNTL